MLTAEPEAPAASQARGREPDAPANARNPELAPRPVLRLAAKEAAERVSLVAQEAAALIAQEPRV